LTCNIKWLCRNDFIGKFKFNLLILFNIDKYFSTPFRDKKGKSSPAYSERDKIGKPFGKIDKNALLEIERCLAVFLGFA